MRTTYRRLTWVAVVGTATGVGLAGTTHLATPAVTTLVGYGTSIPAPAAEVRAGQFTIRGRVSHLYPGESTRLVLTVTDPFAFPITVTSLTTTVGNASAPCVAANLHVGGFSGALRVAAGRSRTVGVQVTLRRSTPDACQGRTFPLTYHGLARRS